MAYHSLRSFLERLERAGELVRVREPVDPVLEMAALADRAAKQGGPALLFENTGRGSLPGRDEPVRDRAPHAPGRSPARTWKRPRESCASSCTWRPR